MKKYFFSFLWATILLIVLLACGSGQTFDIGYNDEAREEIEDAQDVLNRLIKTCYGGENVGLGFDKNSDECWDFTHPPSSSSKIPSSSSRVVSSSSLAISSSSGAISSSSRAASSSSRAVSSSSRAASSSSRAVSSSSNRSSSSVAPAVTLTCGSVPATGTVGTAISGSQRPTQTCSNGQTASGSTWQYSTNNGTTWTNFNWPSAGSWSPPAAGTYTIKVTNKCGTATDLQATCSGTLTVRSSSSR